MKYSRQSLVRPQRCSHTDGEILGLFFLCLQMMKETCGKDFWEGVEVSIFGFRFPGTGRAMRFIPMLRRSRLIDAQKFEKSPGHLFPPAHLPVNLRERLQLGKRGRDGLAA